MAPSPCVSSEGSAGGGVAINEEEVEALVDRARLAASSSQLLQGGHPIEGSLSACSMETNGVAPRASLGELGAVALGVERPSDEFEWGGLC